jgi:hypothetical protein
MSTPPYIYFEEDEENAPYAIVDTYDLHYENGYEYAATDPYCVPVGMGWEFPPYREESCGVLLAFVWRRRLHYSANGNGRSMR